MESAILFLTNILLLEALVLIIPATIILLGISEKVRSRFGIVLAYRSHKHNPGMLFDPKMRRVYLAWSFPVGFLEEFFFRTVPILILVLLGLPPLWVIGIAFMVSTVLQTKMYGGVGRIREKDCISDQGVLNPYRARSIGMFALPIPAVLQDAMMWLIYLTHGFWIAGLIHALTNLGTLWFFCLWLDKLSDDEREKYGIRGKN